MNTPHAKFVRALGRDIQNGRSFIERPLRIPLKRPTQELLLNGRAAPLRRVVRCDATQLDLGVDEGGVQGR